MQTRLLEDAPREGLHARCLCCHSRSLRALWVTFFMNTLFTIAQAFGSIIAHSKALGADTGTMFVDSATYLINIYAEYLKVRGFSERTCAVVDIIASVVSAISLLVVTGVFLFVSIDDLEEVGSGDDGEDVNGMVMVFFTVGNLLIDLGMVGSILLRNRGGWKGFFTCQMHKREVYTITSPVAASEGGTTTLASPVADDDGEACEHDKPTATGDLNVFSALAHVLADTMRTVTEMACGVLVWADPSIDGGKADNVSAIIVCGIILAITLYIIHETIVLVKDELAIRRALKQQPRPEMASTIEGVYVQGR